MDYDTEVKNEPLQSTTWVTTANIENRRDTSAYNYTWYRFKTGKTN